MIKSKILREGDTIRYFDREGNELHEGDVVAFDAVICPEGKVRTERLYLTTEGTLGTDATNPKWLADGRAYPCQYGIYELTNADMEHVVLVNENDPVKVLPSEFKTVTELVLYNSCGCEIGREQYTTEEEMTAVLNRWARIIQAGDRVEVVERESEC